ncbi:Hypothetical protein FKW44_016300 [Caligus rogercresseyi]|uniref:Uncharacterized protein n=1 Tax=Caligus rogercresseyi TaxID=217165 RepID=A0A7T8H1K1_CALRO|nr:Hypothetical protein FKW44_016300 [Caligus rogercresseyi]
MSDGPRRAPRPSWRAGSGRSAEFAASSRQGRGQQEEQHPTPVAVMVMLLGDRGTAGSVLRHGSQPRRVPVAVLLTAAHESTTGETSSPRWKTPLRSAGVSMRVGRFLTGRSG